MKSRIAVSLLLAANAASAAAPMSDWVVYQRGSALELAVDRNAITVDKDGLVRFVNQERFDKRQFDKANDVEFYIRRIEGFADCTKASYAFVSVSYYNKNNRHVWSQMFPVQRHSWQWNSVEQGSVAHAMLYQVCLFARNAPKTRT